MLGGSSTLTQGSVVVRENAAPALDAPFAQAMRDVLRDPQLDAAFKELVLTLPAEGVVAEHLEKEVQDRAKEKLEEIYARL